LSSPLAGVKPQELAQQLVSESNIPVDTLMGLFASIGWLAPYWSGNPLAKQRCEFPARAPISALRNNRDTGAYPRSATRSTPVIGATVARSWRTTASGLKQSVDRESWASAIGRVEPRRGSSSPP